MSKDGDTALVGAHNDDDNGANSGSVYVFVRNGTEWSQWSKQTASDGGDQDRLGWSVSVSGDTGLAGAAGNVHKGTKSGSSYVFVKATDGFGN